MSKSRILKVFLAALLVSLAANAEVSTRPNILIIVSEDNGPELGCYGDPYVQTPNLDRLASQGVRFQHAYVPQAGCSQSRAAYMTGLYPHQNGQIGLATWKFRMYREDTPNLVRSLKNVGYRTGLIGKLHVNPASAFPFDSHKIPSANFGRKNLGDYAKYAREFIDAGEAPFFLSVNYPDPHRPFIRQIEGLPEKPLEPEDVTPLAYFGLESPELRQQTADYYNCMNRLDTMIGDLLQALEVSGKTKDTLVIYFGDHGADLLRGKRTSYEGGVRIPMMIRWPDHVPAGSVRNELVTTLDLFPTLLEAIGEKRTTSLVGRSLTPLWKGGGDDWRKYLFTEYHLHSAHNFYPQRTIRNARYKLVQNLMPNQVNPGFYFTLNRFFGGLPGVIENAPELIRNSYSRMRRPQEFELYDLQADPFEFDDLSQSDDLRPVLGELKSELHAWRRETSDPLLDQGNLEKLRAEIKACFTKGNPEKGRLKLNYPEYFFPKAK